MKKNAYFIHDTGDNTVFARTEEGLNSWFFLDLVLENKREVIGFDTKALAEQAPGHIFWTTFKIIDEDEYKRLLIQEALK